MRVCMMSIRAREPEKCCTKKNCGYSRFVAGGHRIDACALYACTRHVCVFMTRIYAPLHEDEAIFIAYKL